MIVIDITANNIHMLCAHQTKDTIVVDGFAQLPLPARLSEDGLEDIPALADALRAAFAQYNFKERDATILLSGATVISHELEVPYENKPAAMMNILAGELSDVLGRDDHVFDYAIMDTYEKQQTAYCRLYAYLVKRKLVADAQTLLREAGKRPRCFTVSQNCFYHLYSEDSVLFGQTIIAAYIDQHMVSVHLISGPGQILTRTYPVEPGQSVEDVAGEQISRMLQFQTIKQPGNPPQHIYMFGDCADDAMHSALAASLGMDIPPLQSPDNLQAPGGFDFTKYVYAIGALFER